LEGLLVELDGLRHPIGVARGGGLPREFVEGSGSAGRHKCNETGEQAGPALPLPEHHCVVSTAVPGRRLRQAQPDARPLPNLRGGETIAHRRRNRLPSPVKDRNVFRSALVYGSVMSEPKSLTPD
jgi:hypothetical protein